MRRRFFHPKHNTARVNVTPMIDVVMVLIVFYLIVGKLASDRIEAMELPPARHGDETPPADPLVINILPGENGHRVVIEKFEVPLEAVERAVRARVERDPRGVAVQVRASRSLAYGAVRPTLDACRRAGAASIMISAERVP